MPNLKEVNIEIGVDTDQGLVYLKISGPSGEEMEIGIPPEHAISVGQALQKCAGNLGN